MESDPIGTEDFGPGRHIARYTIVRRLGAGGMGAVYEARHTTLGKAVAIKVLLSAARRDAAVVERFVREGTAAARVRHPNVVDVTDVGAEGGVPYLVMELLEGEDLGRRLSRERVLSVTTAADLLVPVCAAVDAAHGVGVVHRDLKPENIVLAHAATGGGVVPKVVDFGIAKVLDEDRPPTLTGTDNIVGTPGYMAPEQVRDSRLVDARTDQYALGTILYECVAGVHPFGTGSIYQVLTAIAEGKFAPPRSVEPALPAALEQIILRAMAHAPEARFASMLALGRALLPFASEATRAAWGAAFADAPPDATPSPRATRAGAATAREPSVDTNEFAPTVEQRSPTLNGTPREILRPQTRGRARSRLGTTAAVAAVLLGGASLALVLRAGPSPRAAPARAAPPRATTRAATSSSLAPQLAVPREAAPAPAAPVDPPRETPPPPPPPGADVAAATTVASRTGVRPPRRATRGVDAGAARRAAARAPNPTDSPPAGASSPAAPVRPNGAINLR